jgi:hypothetical protein
MSKRYRIDPRQVQDDFVWDLHETATEQTVETYYFKDDARKVMKFMESGGAFSGWTPAFMLIKVSSVLDINREFSAKFSD